MLSDLDLVLGIRRGVVRGTSALQHSIEARRVIDALRTHGSLLFVDLQIEGELDLASVEMLTTAIFRNCDLEKVDACYLETRCAFRFIGCTIREWNGVGSTIKSELAFIDCTIEKCTLVGSRIGRAFVASECRIAQLALSAANCPDVILSHSTFGSVALDGLEAANGLTIEGSKARSLNAVDLRTEVVYAMNFVCPSVSLNRAQISGEVNFSGARVADEFSLSGTKVGTDIDLSDARIGSLKMSRARCPFLRFHDIVVFREVSIHYSELGIVELSGKIFGGFKIFDSRFSGMVMFRGVLVHGRTIFERNQIASSLTVGDDEKGITTFFREAASFANTVCVGQLRLKAKFGEDLSLVASQAFDIRAEGSSIPGKLVVSSVRADQTMSLAGCTVGSDLDAHSVRAGREVILESADVSGEIVFDNARIDGSMNARNLRAKSLKMSFATVQGVVTLVGASIKESIEMVGSEIAQLKFDEDTRQIEGAFDFPVSLVMRDTRFGSISVAWRNYLNRLLSVKPYDSTAPAMLERSFRTIGRADWADSVYFASRQRAVGELPRRFARGGQRAIEWISGYGARPTRLLVSAFVVIASMVLLLLVGFYRGSVIPVPPLATPDRVQLAVLAVFDVIVRGEKSELFDAVSFHVYSAEAQLITLVLLAMRYIVLGLVGVWIAYLTGLVGYVGSSRKS